MTRFIARLLLSLTLLLSSMPSYASISLAPEPPANEQSHHHHMASHCQQQAAEPIQCEHCQQAQCDMSCGQCAHISASIIPLTQTNFPEYSAMSIHPQTNESTPEKTVSTLDRPPIQ